MANILVVDDEEGIREFLSDALELDDHSVSEANSAEAAIATLKKQSFSLVITDLNMPGMGGMELLRWIRQQQPEVEVIVLTAHGTVDTAVEAMKTGAFEFLQKPIGGPEELQLVAARALERRKLKDRADSSARSHTRSTTLSYGAASMVAVQRALEKVAPTHATVLLLGESGSGKEVAARHLHELSPRRDQPFMAINCAALTETLLESELFGHEKGAFTGADERRRGRIELADGGTFFLDEVGELRPELQAKLLRVLQEKRFERVGGTQSISVDVRWVAATNRDLQAMMSSGEFREDLYHRLAVFPIQLPPLRERGEDLVPLATALLQSAAKEMGRGALQLSPEAEAKICAYPWPGNIRELKNSLERAAILCDGQVIQADDLWLEDKSSSGAAPRAADPVAAIRPLLEVEKQAIADALAAVEGNRRRAAELLGIGERTLYDKIKRYGL